MNEQQLSTETKRPNHKRRWAIAGIAGMAAAGLFAMAAHGHGGPGHHGHARHGMWSEMSPEEAGKRIDKMVARVLEDVGATPEQKQKVTDIAKQAAQELIPMRDAHRAARGRAADLLTQPTIDRNALEQLRAEELRLGETVSKRMTTALADAAEVLTPEQRTKLVAKWKKRHG